MVGALMTAGQRSLSLQGGRSPILNVRMPSDMYAAFNQRAAEEKMTPSQLGRLLIGNYMRQSGPPTEVIARVKEIEASLGELKEMLRSIGIEL
jgi:hypothetical protein